MENQGKQAGKMRLHWSPTSPFVRKVLMAAIELNLDDRIDRVRTPVAMASSNAALLTENPLGKLPTLILASGKAVFDSRVIVHHLDAMASGPSLYPSDPAALLDTLRAEALGDGLLDLLVLWRNESGRPVAARSAQHLSAYEIKTIATFDRLELECGALGATPFDVGHISIGCALSYTDFRFPDLPWREGRSALAEWHASFEARPSALATAVPT